LEQLHLSGPAEHHLRQRLTANPLSGRADRSVPWLAVGRSLVLGSGPAAVRVEQRAQSAGGGQHPITVMPDPGHVVQSLAQRLAVTTLQGREIGMTARIAVRPLRL